MPDRHVGASSAARTGGRRRGKFWTSSAYHLLVVASFTIGVKILGAGKSAVSARIFGIGRELDCYLVAFGLVSLVCETVAGALTPALIPALAEVRLSVAIDKIRRNYGNILYPACALLILAAILASLFDRLAFQLLASGFSAPDLLLTHKILLLLLPIFPASAAAAVWRAFLNSEESFGLTSCAPGLTPALATLFVLLHVPPGGIHAFALGTSAGALAEVTILGVAVRQFKYAIFPGFNFRLRPGWLRHEYLPMLATNFIGGSRNAVDQAVAATLGPGSVSVLNLGTRLVTVAMSIGPTALGTVLLPRLSRLAALDDRVSVRKLVVKTAIAGCSLACAVSIIAVLFSGPLAYLAFQKGAERALNLPLLAGVQAISFTQLPFAFLSTILARVAVSARLNRSLMLISIGGGLANILLDVFCSRHLGIAGIALASTIMYALTAAALLLATCLRHLFTAADRSVAVLLEM